MLPWGEMLRAALAAGLPPAAFWRLSLREWRWIAASRGGPGRGELEALMAQYPDDKETGT
ncbi:phage tail assembly chaperone [Hyphomonas sp.]|uniref:phage tail assembly chaperone n=1 Tax=Hyphomonas sp. TaxID=87 RepID=UPI00391CF6C8